MWIAKVDSLRGEPVPISPYWYSGNKFSARLEGMGGYTSSCLRVITNLCLTHPGKRHVVSVLNPSCLLRVYNEVIDYVDKAYDAAPSLPQCTSREWRVTEGIIRFTNGSTIEVVPGEEETIDVDRNVGHAQELA